MLHLEEPLHGELGFDCNACTFRATYLVCVGFYFFHQSCFLQVLLNLATNVEAVHADVHACCFRECAVVVEYVD